MADLGGQFDAESVEPLGDRSPIPAGKYRCVITKSDWKHTKNGNGRFMELTFQIVEGDHKGRMVWSRLNLENASGQAVQIARAELSSICRSVGKLKPRDTSELHDIPLVVSVAVKNRADGNGLTNEIKGYESVRQASEAKQTVTAGNDSKPNWM